MQTSSMGMYVIMYVVIECSSHVSWYNKHVSFSFGLQFSFDVNYVHKLIVTLGFIQLMVVALLTLIPCVYLYVHIVCIYIHAYTHAYSVLLMIRILILLGTSLWCTNFVAQGT